ncbi:IclR family transcriptional regulator [Dactylosporangium vinaceum]|uniref:IclR family transcriptional regulator n=1 Tax=Dactylosporangium vinaceum TaxID=53362 RepID=A0ABV5MJ40_9ACTN|nr:IclR family transcriptional regulator [Dactylosporangium vinaceum]UAB93678.1 IclR family transcriptional regulator [Dactylosporangium vinaceum]
MADESPTLDLLERLAAAPDRMTIDALCRQIGLPEPLVRGRLAHLVARGWVDADAEGVSYAIGVGALRPGSAYLSADRTARLAGPILSRLRDQLDESVRLVRLDGAAIVCLACRESAHDPAGPVVGRRFPAISAASGRAILAHRAPAEVDAILDDGVQAHTIDSVVSRAELYAALADCRTRGVAYERGELIPGVGCLAAAVRVPGLPVTDAISCGVPLPRLTPDHTDDIATALHHATATLAELLT